ncbi:MAG: 30S ribosomal protein S20 [Nitrospirota bacterium]
MAKAAPKKNLSALKKTRQDEKRRLRNQSVESSIKTSTKKIESLLAAGSKDELAKELKKTVSTIDKAASKGVIHKNTASRKIARLSKKVQGALS